MTILSRLLLKRGGEPHEVKRGRGAGTTSNIRGFTEEFVVIRILKHLECMVLNTGIVVFTVRVELASTVRAATGKSRTSPVSRSFDRAMSSDPVRECDCFPMTVYSAVSQTF